MRIKLIRVNKLFGVFDHVIPLNMGDRITIIHGPNGFGKTSMLKIINGLFRSNFDYIETVPFASIDVEMDNGDRILVEKLNQPEAESDEQTKLMKLIVSLITTEGSVLYFSPEKVQIPGRRVVRDTNGRIISMDSIEEWGLPQWWEEYTRAFSLCLIETQRLVRNFGKRTTTPKQAVDAYAVELANQIQITLAKYADLSQSLDRSFPSRLLDQKSHESDIAFTQGQLVEKLRELEDQRTHLMEAGLLDKENAEEFRFPETIDEETRNVLFIYIQDVEKKLSVFDDLAKKLEVFKNIINERFRYKKLEIDKEKGFFFTTSLGEPLPPTKLSSGEQHELVLLYDFLFRVETNSLILLDEPELSFHVAWQNQFLKDLQRITQLGLFDVLIATHSPLIIDDRWDLTVELRG